jgi:hypothetical protein
MNLHLADASTDTILSLPSAAACVAAWIAESGVAIGAIAMQALSAEEADLRLLDEAARPYAALELAELWRGIEANHLSALGHFAQDSVEADARIAAIDSAQLREIRLLGRFGDTITRGAVALAAADALDRAIDAKDGRADIAGLMARRAERLVAAAASRGKASSRAHLALHQARTELLTTVLPRLRSRPDMRLIAAARDLESALQEGLTGRAADDDAFVELTDKSW